MAAALRAHALSKLAGAPYHPAFPRLEATRRVFGRFTLLHCRPTTGAVEDEYLDVYDGGKVMALCRQHGAQRWDVIHLAAGEWQALFLAT